MLQSEQRGPNEVQTSQPLTQNPPQDQSQPSQPTQPTQTTQPTQPTHPSQTTQNQPQAGVHSKGKCVGSGAAAKGDKEAMKRKI